MADSSRLLTRQKDLNRTFIGLDRACRNCHFDEHRGQLAIECQACHTFDGWRPAPGFDHGKTTFALTGKHALVECGKCHVLIADEQSEPDRDFLKFAGLNHGDCADCHQDVHRGKFAGGCTHCHSTSGWKDINRAVFDHSKTKFALEGKHVSVACEKCHLPGKPLAGLSYSLCRDCHEDKHQGQFAARKDGGECGSCHTVDGFVPSTYTVAQHLESDYPLAGSHLAVPCISCHTRFETTDGVQGTRFVFGSTRCNDCHRDPHAGQVEKYVAMSGCEHCHSVESWRTISFDHSKTAFVLNGKHGQIACRSCHEQGVGPEKQHLVLAKVDVRCQGCHRDVHRGQFAQVAGVDGAPSFTDCGHCHSATNWSPDKFDHNRDAAFKLEGAHQKVPCAGCHKKMAEQDESFTWFKPIDTACKHCHDIEELQDSLRRP